MSRSVDVLSSSKSGAFPAPVAFWGLAFLYATFAALSFQKLVLPLFPDLHAGHGLLHNDAILFHNMAQELAGRIVQHGWTEWQLLPGTAANVGILAALYALFGPDPAWFIPINAAAHAAGATLIYRLGSVLWPGPVGSLGGVIAGIAFLTFPSALQWYGQNHRDAFAIAGVLGVLLAWLKAYDAVSERTSRIAHLFCLALAGSILLGLARPYFPVVLALALLISFSVTEAFFLLRGEARGGNPLAAKGAVLVAVLLVGSVLVLQKVDSANYYRTLNESSDIQAPRITEVRWAWQPSEILPSAIDRVFQRAAEFRVGMLAFGQAVGAGSSIDPDSMPANAYEVLAYLPRALWTGLFSPFPQTWTERVSAPRLVGAIETAIWYLMSLGVLVTVARAGSGKLLAGLVFSFVILIVLSFVHPNVGTLYRQRYGVWHFVFLCGAIGWASVLLGVLHGRRFSAAGTGDGKNTQQGIRGGASQIDTLAASGAVVLLITLACYLGFLTRDLLLVKQLRMGADLDAFFTAAMIPMFFVTCLAMPLADAMTTPFLSFGRDGQEKRRAEFVRRLLGFAVAILGAVAVLVLLASPYAVGFVLGETDSETALSATGMLRWFAPIILLSAWTVIGNAVLNALRHSRDAALGQLVVPVTTISTLLAAPATAAPYAAIAGMLAGTLLNAAWVFCRLLPHGICLLPVPPATELLRSTTASYRRLFLAASLTAALVPLNYAFAASVVSGGVSAWALANKIVVLFTGLASVGASAVVLPYLARMLAQGAGVRDDAHFLLVAGSWIGGLLAVGALLFADPLVAAALSGSVTPSQLADLSGIVKIGVLQLPVAIAGALIAKMAIVSGASSRVLFAATLGFICNLSVNLLLVPLLGVLGVAVGALAATTLATLTLMLAAREKIGLTLREIATLLVGWLVWAGTGGAAGSQSAAAIACAVLAVIGLAWAQFMSWATARR